MKSSLFAIQYKFIKYQMLLMTLAVALQRSPMMRIIVTLEKAIKAPIARMIQYSTAAVAAIGTQQAVTGATTFTSSPSSPTTATVGTQFNLVFAVTGAPSAVGSWRVKGDIPPGVTIPGLNGSTLNVKIGMMTGTPTTPGTYNLTVQAFEKSNLNGDTNEKKYPISITVEGDALPPETIFTATPSANIGGQVATPLSQSFSISGINAASWKITGGLPAGLTLKGPSGQTQQGNILNAPSGQITGTPTESGVFNISLEAYDQANLAGITDEKQHALTLTIGAEPLPPETIFTATPSPNIGGQVAKPLSQSFSINGISAASWKVTGGLPAGLTLKGPSGQTQQGNILNAPSGLITGTPTESGVFNISLEAYDKANLAGITDEKQHALTLTIEAEPLPPETTFAATPSANISGQVGTPLSQSFSISGINASSWKITGGLPAGLTLKGPSGQTQQGNILNAPSGQITGTPTESGVFNISLEAYDEANLSGITDEKQHALTLTIEAEPLPPETTFTATPSASISGQVGTPLSQSFSISGITAASWKVTGSLPAGLTLKGPSGQTQQGNILNAPSGQITGTPTESGVFNISLEAYDQANFAGITDEKQHALTLTIEAAVANLPDVTYQPKDTTVYSQDRVQFFVNGENFTSIQWLKDGTDIPGAQDLTFIIDNAGSGDTGSYQARLSNADGSSVSAAATLTIDPNAQAQLINLSTRGFVGKGEQVMIPGFAFEGEKSKTFLIRAAGPALFDQFGLETFLENPVIMLFDGVNLLASNDDWGSQTNVAAIEQAIIDVGAFPFDANSMDAAMIVTLTPGGYTAITFGESDTTGTALIEVYEIIQ